MAQRRFAAVGFEPTTDCLAKKCELRVRLEHAPFFGAPLYNPRSDVF